MALVYKFSPGKLPEAIAKTAVSFVARSDFDAASHPVAEGMRHAFVGFKVKEATAEKAKTEDVEVPKSFCVQVPMFATFKAAILAQPKGQDFLDGLLLDAQNEAIAAVAKGANYDPTDAATIVRNYFESNREAPSMRELFGLGKSHPKSEAWMAKTFAPALVARMLQRNATAEADGCKVITDEAMAATVERYELNLKGIMESPPTIPRTAIAGLRQWITLLVEKQLLADDRITKFIVSRCLTLEKSPDETIQEAC